MPLPSRGRCGPDGKPEVARRLLDSGPGRPGSLVRLAGVSRRRVGGPERAAGAVASPARGADRPRPGGLGAAQRGEPGAGRLDPALPGLRAFVWRGPPHAGLRVPVRAGPGPHRPGGVVRGRPPDWRAGRVRRGGRPVARFGAAASAAILALVDPESEFFG